MIEFGIPVLGIIAASGTGKTTLLVRLIPILTARGIRIALIKHSHHDFEIDHPNKDSYLLRKAGATPVLLISRYRRAIISDLNLDQEPSLLEQLHQLDVSSLDLVLVEGFSNEAIPKIELHRKRLNMPLRCIDDPSVIAVATDEPLTLTPLLIQLDLNQPEQIARFILDRILQYDH